MQWAKLGISWWKNNSYRIRRIHPALNQDSSERSLTSRKRRDIINRCVWSLSQLKSLRDHFSARVARERRVCRLTVINRCFRFGLNKRDSSPNAGNYKEKKSRGGGYNCSLDNPQWTALPDHHRWQLRVAEQFDVLVGHWLSVAWIHQKWKCTSCLHDSVKFTFTQCHRAIPTPRKVIRIATHIAVPKVFRSLLFSAFVSFVSGLNNAPSRNNATWTDTRICRARWISPWKYSIAITRSLLLPHRPFKIRDRDSWGRFFPFIVHHETANCYNLGNSLRFPCWSSWKIRYIFRSQLYALVVSIMSLREPVYTTRDTWSISFSLL